MRNSSRHIVSKISWDLSFDKREKIQDLQSKFGAWSKVDMLEEMNELFSGICPLDQTWKIDELTIDLGDLNYDELEDELPKRFRLALYEKLVEMTYQSVRGDRKIQILDGNSTLLELFSKYLISGYLPWNETGVISINELFLGQYRNNHQNLIERIKELSKSIRVRRRIAWQFNEASIKILIKEIEPNNYTEIFDFTDEFSKVQEKETILQTSTSEFRKTLWFWVLNHLFEERGTLFNRLSFMESTIEQMAQHYNLSFARLLQDIEFAVEKISKIYTLKSDFVKALELISKRQSKRQLQLDQKQENQGYYFEQLRIWLIEGQSNATNLTSKSANELLVRLAQSHPEQMKELLKSLHFDTSRIKNQISLLTPQTLQALTSLFAVRKGRHLSILIEHLREFSSKKGLSFKNWNRVVLKYLCSISSQTDSMVVLFEELRKESQHDTKKLVKLCYATFLEEELGSEVVKSIDPTVYRSFVSLVHQLNYDYSSNNQLEKTDWFLNLFQKNLDQFGFTDNFFKSQDPEALNFHSIVTKQPEFLIEVMRELSKNKKAFNGFFNYLNDRQVSVLAGHLFLKQDAFLEDFVNVMESIIEPLTFTARSAITREYQSLIIYWKLNSNNTNTELAWSQYAVVKLIFYLERKHANDFLFVATRLIRHVKLTSKIKNWLTAYTDNKLVTLELSTLCEQAEVMTKTGIDRKLLLRLFIRNGQVSQQNKRSVLNSNVLYKIMNLFIPELANTYKKITSEPNKLFQINLGYVFDLKEVDLIFWNLLLDEKKHEFKLETFIKNMKQALLKLVQGRAELRLDDLDSSKKDAEKLMNGTKSLITNKFPKDLLYTLNTHEGTADSLVVQKLIQETLEKSVDELLLVLKKSRLTAIKFAKIMEGTDLTVFAAQILSSKNVYKTNFLAIYEFLSGLVDKKGSTEISFKLRENAWILLFKIIQNEPRIKDSLKELVFTISRELSLMRGLKSSDILQIIRLKKTNLTPFLKEILIQLNPVFESIELPEKLSENSEYVKKILSSDLADELIENCLFLNKLPAWFILPKSIPAKELLKLILKDCPYEFQKYIQTTNRLDEFIAKLYQIICKSSPSTWVDYLRNVGITKDNTVSEIASLFSFFEQISTENLKQLKKEVLLKILFRKTIMALKSGRWDRLTPRILWQEIIWDATAGFGAIEHELMAEIMTMNERLSVNLRMSLIQLVELKNAQSNQQTNSNSAVIKKLANNSEITSEKPALITEGISINNAGLVLVNGYVKTLFDRLILIENDRFKNQEAVDSAVHYLQYVVNGLTHNEEHFLVLNKIICGLHPSNEVSDGLEISDANKTLIDGMIQAIINYWPAIGDCSINGFRGNWLIRDGIIREENDRWNLIIEKRAYDILIQQAPFSFGIIKHPWMEKPIHVNWPY